jgi:hypothetical protein
MHLVAPGNREEFVKDVHAIHFCLCISRVSPDSRNQAAQWRGRGALVPRRRATCILPSETHGINAHFPSTFPTLLEVAGLEVGLRKVFCKRGVSFACWNWSGADKERCLCRVQDLEHPLGGGFERGYCNDPECTDQPPWGGEFNGLWSFARGQGEENSYRLLAIAWAR